MMMMISRQSGSSLLRQIPGNIIFLFNAAVLHFKFLVFFIFYYCFVLFYLRKQQLKLWWSNLQIWKWNCEWGGDAEKGRRMNQPREAQSLVATLQSYASPPLGFPPTLQKVPPTQHIAPRTHPLGPFCGLAHMHKNAIVCSGTAEIQ